MRILLQISAAGFCALAGVATAHATCKCLNRGVEVPEGKTACIKTDKGPKLALCEKNLNVTNWKFLGVECPTAMRTGKLSQEPKVAALGRLPAS